jgi:hypothetical protein
MEEDRKYKLEMGMLYEESDDDSAMETFGLGMSSSNEDNDE